MRNGFEGINNREEGVEEVFGAEKFGFSSELVNNGEELIFGQNINNVRMEDKENARTKIEQDSGEVAKSNEVSRVIDESLRADGTFRSKEMGKHFSDLMLKKFADDKDNPSMLNDDVNMFSRSFISGAFGRNIGGDKK